MLELLHKSELLTDQNSNLIISLLLDENLCDIIRTMLYVLLNNMQLTLIEFVHNLSGLKNYCVIEDKTYVS